MKGLPDSRSGLIIGDLLASLVQKMIFQLTDKVQEGIARFPPLSRSYGSEAGEFSGSLVTANRRPEKFLQEEVANQPYLDPSSSKFNETYYG